MVPDCEHRDAMTPGMRRRLLGLIEKFEAAWSSESSPRLVAKFAKALPPGPLQAAWIDLANVDLERRIAAGLSLDVRASYLDRFRGVAGCRTCLLDLFETEYRHRRDPEGQGSTTMDFARIPEDLRADLRKRLNPFEGYELLDELGRGAMGVVYRARQGRLGRLVAVKTLHGAGIGDASLASRFANEAKVVARLKHPNIVAVYDVGEGMGRPYLAMELVEGGTLESRIGSGPRPPSEAATMVETLSRAMGVVHSSGIVHRDLKPGNVLLTPEGQPKIADFGLAALRDPTGAELRQQTSLGDLIGTPNYMAPEQAKGDARSVGPAADVYALGAILYRMLTGRPPFLGSSQADTIAQVLAGDPLPPRRVTRGVPASLEAVAMKCLNTNPSRRYAGAEELADDLRNFREHRRMVARPDGPVPAIFKWSIRHPALASIAIAAAVLIAVLLVSNRRMNIYAAELTSAAVRNAEADGVEATFTGNGERALYSFALALLLGRDDPAVRTRNRLRLLSFLGMMPRLERPLYHDEDIRGYAYRPGPGPERVITIGNRAVRLWDPSSSMVLRTWDHPSQVNFYIFDPGGTAVLTVDEAGTVRLWPLEADAPARSLDLRGTALYLAGFDPSGRFVSLVVDHQVSDRADKTLVANTLLVWDVSTGQTRELPQEDVIISSAMSPTAPRVAVSSKRTVVVLGVDDGAEVCRWTHKDRLNTVAFSPDGKSVAAGGEDATVSVHDAATGSLRWSQFTQRSSAVQSLKFSEDGRLLTVVSRSDSLVYDAATGRLGAAEFPDDVQSRFDSRLVSPDLRRVLKDGTDRSVRITDLAGQNIPAGNRILFTQGIPALVPGQGGSLAVLAGDGRVTTDATRYHLERLPNAFWHAAAFDPEGVLVLADMARVIRLRPGPAGELSTRETGGGESPWLSENGRFLAAFDRPLGQSVRVLETKTGRQVGIIHPEPGTFTLVVSPRGDRVVAIRDRVLGSNPTLAVDLTLWDSGGVRVAALAKVFRTSQVSFSRDGSLILVASIGEDEAKIFEASSGKQVANSFEHLTLVSARFSPNGSRLVTTGNDAMARVWDVASGQALAEVAHKARVEAADFSPDGLYLATASADRLARVWDAETGSPISALLVHDAPVDGVRFSADGLRVFTFCREDRTAHSWEFGDDPGWSDDDLIHAAEVYASVELGIEGPKPLGSERSRAEWPELILRHAEMFKCNDFQARRFYLRQAVASDRSGDWATSAKHYSRLAADPEFAGNGYYLARKGNALLQSGRNDEALPILRAAAGKSPENSYVQFLLALTLMNQFDFKESNDTFDRIIKWNGGPEKSAGPELFNRGWCQLAMGRWDGAVSDFRLALKRGGLKADSVTEPTILRYIALALLKSGKVPDYVAHRQDVLSRHREAFDAVLAHEVAALCVLTPVSEEDRSSTDVLALAKRAFYQYSSHKPYSATLGAAFLRNNDLELADAFLRKSVEDPKEGDILPRERMYLALALIGLGREDEAREHYTKAKGWLDATSARAFGSPTPLDVRLLIYEVDILRQEVESAFARVRLLMMRSAEFQTVEVVGLLRDYKLRPAPEETSGVPWARRAVARARLSALWPSYADWGKVAADLGEAIARDPDRAEWYYYRALALLASGDLPGYQSLCKDVIGHFRQAKPSDRQIAYWTCGLGPNSAADHAVLKSAMESVLDKDSGNGLVIAAGALMVRDGAQRPQCLEAGVMCLQRAASMVEKSYYSEVEPQIKILTLLAFHSLEKPIEFRQGIDEVERLVAEVNASKSKKDYSWHRRLEMNLLLQELHRTIEAEGRAKPP